jgi:hypothetical protein
MIQNTVQETKRRTERYWFEDGIWEIGLGLINIFLAGFFFLAGWMKDQGLPEILYLVIQVLVIVSIYLLMNQVIRFFKERITYPRTGFVQYRRPAPAARARRAAGIGLLAIGLSLGLTLLVSVQTLNAAPLVTSIVLAATLLFFGYRYALLRLYPIAALTIGAGLLVSLLPVKESPSIGYFFLGFGLLLLGSGSIGLAQYLDRHRLDGRDLEDTGGAEEEKPL